MNEYSNRERSIINLTNSSDNYNNSSQLILDASKSLSAYHQKIICEGSGISPEMAALNFYSMVQSEALNKKLNLESYIKVGDGFASDDIDGNAFIYRPDYQIDYFCKKKNKWRKTPKYRRPSGMSPTVRRHHVTSSIAKKILNQSALSEAFVTKYEGHISSCVFWEQVQKDVKIPLHFTEGGKKAVKLLEEGYATLNMDGWYSYRLAEDKCVDEKGVAFSPRTDPRALVESLKDFEFKGRDITLWLDNDLDSEKEDTYAKNQTAIAQFCYFFFKLGANVFVASWDGLKDSNGKTVKGIDDLFVVYGSEKVTEIAKNALTSAGFAHKQRNNWLAIPNLKPTIIDSSRLKGDPKGQPKGNVYLEMDMLQAEKQHKVHFIQSPKGTGKTEIMNHFWLRDARENTPSLVITHRTLLGLNLAERSLSVEKNLFGDAYKILNRLPHIDSGRFNLSTFQSLIFNVDSLLKKSKTNFCRETWNGSRKFNIYIDEFEQVIRHLHMSATLNGKREEVINNFIYIFIACISSGGQVFLFDADLSPIGYNFVMDCLTVKDTSVDKKYCLISKEQTNVVLNKVDLPKVKPLRLEAGQDPSGWRARIINAIANNKRILVFVSGQKEESKNGTTVTFAALQALFPEKKGICIDSETTIQKGNPAAEALHHINETLAEYDFCVASPSMGTGISIDALSGNWDVIFFYASGVLNVDGEAQFLERLRQIDTLRDVFVSTRKINNLTCGGKTFEAGIKAYYKYNLIEMVKGIKTGDIPDCIAAFQSGDSLPSQNYVARRLASDNFLMHEHHDNFIAKIMKEGGYYLAEASDCDELVGYDAADLSEKLTEKKALDIVNATKIDETRAKEIEKGIKRGIKQTEETKNSLSNYKFSKMLGLSTLDAEEELPDITVEQVKELRDGSYLYGKCKNAYNLTKANDAEFSFWQYRVISPDSEKLNNWLDIVHKSLINLKTRLEVIGFTERLKNLDNFDIYDSYAYDKVIQNQNTKNLFFQATDITIAKGKATKTRSAKMDAVMKFNKKLLNKFGYDYKNGKVIDKASNIRSYIEKKLASDWQLKLAEIEGNNDPKEAENLNTTSESVNIKVEQTTENLTTAGDTTNESLQTESEDQQAVCSSEPQEQHCRNTDITHEIHRAGVQSKSRDSAKIVNSVGIECVADEWRNSSTSTQKTRENAEKLPKNVPDCENLNMVSESITKDALDISALPKYELPKWFLYEHGQEVIYSTNNQVRYRVCGVGEGGTSDIRIMSKDNQEYRVRLQDISNPRRTT